MASDIARIAELEREVESLKSAVDNLMSGNAPTAKGVVRASNSSPQALAQVVQLTEQLFPGRALVEVLSDPESPSEIFIVLNVEADGEATQLIGRQCEWHERVAALAGSEASIYRLSIDPQP